MKIVDRKIDAAVQAYSKRWLNSLERPSIPSILSNIVVTFLLLVWSASITAMLGFDLRKGWGTIIFISLWLVFSIVLLLVTRLMSRIGIDRSMRSAFMLAALLGPYISLAANHSWNQPTLSHILGFAGSIIVYIFSLLLDKALLKSHTQSG